MLKDIIFQLKSELHNIREDKLIKRIKYETEIEMLNSHTTYIEKLLWKLQEIQEKEGAENE